MNFRRLLILAATVMMFACTNTTPAYQHHCEEPRPEVCTREYSPVCAVKKNGKEGLYSNGCSACSNNDVTGYNEGACPKP